MALRGHRVGAVPGTEGPTLRRRRLGAALKRYREAAGLTQGQVTRQLEWHAAKVTRIETARVSVTPRDVTDMLTLYGVRDPEHREALTELARASRERAWWADYRDIVQPDSYVSFEAEASAIRNWEPVVLPGLLQTEAYMRALFRTSLTSRPDRVDRAVSLRLARQRRLTGKHPIELGALLDESVLYRPIGGRRAMAGQLRHLLTLSELPNVSVRVLPCGVGEHPLLGMSAALLAFDQAAELDVVFVEGFGRTSHFLRRPQEVARYRAVFDEVAARCLDARATRGAVEAALRTWSRRPSPVR
ncbi:helix-turn-helix domain-containing protein [Actinoplanes sp. URMC 104]|uniref:helix-turn-helix domain-containing protein n=1 Tax=Actinoplanes sp. URMC 104 TaxID=3423409 RepID=UPI003F1D6899